MDLEPDHPLLLACRALGAAFDEQDAVIAAGLHISRNELRLLNALEHGPRPQVDLATQLGLTRGAVTPMVDRLTARGLVQRDISASDRRVNLVSLTPQSWRVLAGQYAPTGQRVLAAVETLSSEAVDHLVTQLLVLTAALHAPDQVADSSTHSPDKGVDGGSSS